MIAAVLIGGGLPAFAHDGAAARKTEVGPFARQAEGPAATSVEGEPPLWDNLGTLSYPVTTSSPLAQRYFDQGLRLSYAFNHAEARRAFRKAQQLDPRCALCYWGEALVLGPNINAPMDPSASAPALAAVRRAEALSGEASAKEQALIEALRARYSPDARAERAALDAAYAAAMGTVAARFSDDQNIAVLYAEALMNLSPWDYWEGGGARPKGKTAETIRVLERVLAANPNHPGAIHFYIHMVEASSAPQRAEPYADRLAALVPGAGHLVHMPSHIYYRVGRYLDSLAANEAAVAVDEAYLAQVKATGIYPLAYYPHNIHFLLASAQMAGEGRTAIRAAEKLAGVVSDEAARTIPWVQPIKAAPYFAHAQFSDPQTVLGLADPGDAFPFVKAMWHYARGTAQAAQGRFEAAQAEAEAITRIDRSTRLEDLAAGGVPAHDILKVARSVVLGRIAQGQGDLAAAIGHFRNAVGVQDGLVYMEPPFWYYPVRQSLGAAILLAGKVDEAEAEFRASLARVPNSGWAIYGLMEVYRARGDERAAREAERLLDRSWAGDRGLLSLRRL